MPDDLIASRMSRITSVVKDAVFLSTLIVSISTAVATTAISIGWPMFIKQLSADLQMATRDDVQAINARIDEITGETKILRVMPGHSYVFEPVTKGEPIEMTLAAARTKKGVACVYQTATPLFLDSRDIPFPGEEVRPIKQLSQQTERLKLTLYAPTTLQTGRVGVYLSMKYVCPWGPDGSSIDVFEETDIIFFQIDPASLRP